MVPIVVGKFWDTNPDSRDAKSIYRLIHREAEKGNLLLPSFAEVQQRVAVGLTIGAFVTCRHCTQRDLVGCCFVLPSSETVEIGSLVVDFSFRRKGFGAMLVKEATNVAKSGRTIFALVSTFEKGEEKHHQPVFLQHRSEFYVVVNQAQEIAFIEIPRPVVIPPELYVDTWGEWRPLPETDQMLIPHPADIQQAAVLQLELPAGLAERNLLEAEEETGCKVEQVACLGHINNDPPFYATSPFVYVCKALPVPSTVPPDPKEGIRRVVWLSPELANAVETLSANTYACLFLFRRWALKQDDPFWTLMGKRL